MKRNTILTILASAGLAFSTSVAQAAGTSSSRGYDETSGVLGTVVTPPNGPTVLGASATRPAAATAPTAVAPSGQVAPAQVAPAAQVTPTQDVSSGGSLPFTGLDLGIVVLMGLALVGTGVALRRGSRRSQLG